MYSLVPFRRSRGRELSTSLLNDNFFNSFFDMSDWFSTPGFRVDVREDDATYHLEAELPGVAKDKLSITVDDGTLTISADLKEEKKEDRGNYLYSERRSGHVQRCFNLEGIDAENITADYQNGVLMINMPKAQPLAKKEPKRIEITGADSQAAPADTL